MNTLSYNFLLDAIMTADVETDSDNWADAIYPDYSGRSMYGRECFGIVLDRDADFTLVMLELNRTLMDNFEDEDTVPSLVKNMRTDNMGMSTIFYFPNWELEDLPPQDEDFDDDE